MIKCEPYSIGSWYWRKLMKIKDEFKERGFSNFTGTYSIAASFKFLNGSSTRVFLETGLVQD